jgi:hypothetical protein
MPTIPRGAIIKTDIKQVGSTTPGSIAHLQIVGEVRRIPDLFPIQIGTTIPRTNIRPFTNKLRGARLKTGQSDAWFSDMGNAFQDLQDIMDKLKTNDEQVKQLLEDLLKHLSRSTLARYNAVMVTPEPLEVDDDVVPWVQITVPLNHVWIPIEAWVVAKVAPEGTPGGAPADSGMIFDVSYATEYNAVNDPIWSSIFPDDDTDPWDRKLILPADQNEVDPPYTVFTPL